MDIWHDQRGIVTWHRQSERMRSRRKPAYETESIHKTEFDFMDGVRICSSMNVYCRVRPHKLTETSFCGGLVNHVPWQILTLVTLLFLQIENWFCVKAEVMLKFASDMTKTIFCSFYYRLMVTNLMYIDTNVLQWVTIFMHSSVCETAQKNHTTRNGNFCKEVTHSI